MEESLEPVVDTSIPIPSVSVNFEDVAAIERDEQSESEKSEPDLYHASTIILQPGSQFIKLEVATSVIPQILRNCLATKRRQKKIIIEKPEDNVTEKASEDKNDNENEKELEEVKKEKGTTTSSRTKKGPEGSSRAKRFKKDDEGHENTESEKTDRIDNIISSIERNYKKKATFRSRPFNTNNMSAFNESYHPEFIPDHLDDQETPWIIPEENKELPQYIVGKEISLLENDDYYELIYPIVDGQLNPNYSYEHLKAIFYHLWTNLIEKYLKVPPSELNEFQLVIVVPDFPSKKQVRLYCEVALDLINFKSILLHQESVCATFGGGLPSACVLDIGAQKTTVCCVEDGHLLINHRLWLPIGGDDVTKTFFKLLKRVGFPYKSCDLSSYLDWELMDEMKRNYCHLFEEGVKTETRHFYVRRPNKKTSKYSFKFAEEPFRASLALFYGSLGLSKPPNIESLKELDPEDIQEEIDTGSLSSDRVKYNATSRNKTGSSMDEVNVCKYNGCGKEFEDAGRLYIHLNETHRKMTKTGFVCKWEGCARGPKPFTNKPSIISHFRTHVNITKALDQIGSLTTSMNPSPSPALDSETNTLEGKKPTSPVNLIEAINIALTGLTEDSKKKMLSNILLVGGGLNLTEFTNTFFTMLIAYFPTYDIEVVLSPKDIEPQILSWKGASILAQLDQASEFWISPEEWETRKLNVVREISPVIF